MYLRPRAVLATILSVTFTFLPMFRSAFAGEILDDVRVRKVVRCGYF